MAALRVALVNQFNRVRRSGFARNVAIVATGTVGAQAITMAFAPFITRLYGPEVFGTLGAFTAVVAVIAPLAAFSYPIAIVLPRQDQDALGIVRLSAYLSFAMAVLVALGLWTGGDWLVALLGIESIAAFIVLIPAAILFRAWLQITLHWLVRKKQFKLTAKLAVLNSLLLNLAKTGIGWYHPVAAVLILVTLAGTVLHAMMLVFGARRRFAAEPVVEGTPPARRLSLKSLARQHYDFPLYRTPEIVINAASQSLPILMLTAFFGPASAGFYALGRSVVGLPSLLVGNSVGTVFYPRIAEAARNGENLSSLIIKATVGLATVGVLPYAIIIAFGPFLFGLVFGSEWVMAGEYARWLAVWLFFLFLNSPAVKAIPVLELQRFHLVFSCYTITTRVAVLYVGYFLFDSDVVAIALFGIAGMINNIILILIVIYFSGRYVGPTRAGS